MTVQQKLAALSLLLISCSADARADYVRLVNTGVLRGLIDRKTADDEEAPVRITLLSGTVVTVARANVSELVRRPIKYEEYEFLVRKLPDTLEAHWETAEWCRKKNLDDERASHLRRVIEFDPEHRRAHYGLGHTNHKGEWLTKEQYEDLRRSEGYVKFNNKWVAAEKLGSLQASDKRSKAELAWFQKVRVWMKQASGSDPRLAQDGVSNLKSIRDPDAIPALVQFLGKSGNVDVRRLFIDLSSRIGGAGPVRMLTTMAIRDMNRDLRSHALDSIPDEHHEIAQSVLIAGLRDKKNFVVRRSGFALGKTGDEKAVPALMQALETTHSYRIRVPVQRVSLGANGTMGGGGYRLPPEIEAGLRLGLYDHVQVIPSPFSQPVPTKEVPVAVKQQNPEVYATLKKLTGQDFGYNEPRWLKWWNVDRNQDKLAPDLK